MAKIRVRARTVDMLGRQQISNIPTAIHELFKNAHDAYAEHVEVDYYRHDAAFILRDDGYGMTVEDFQNRWLTLGTESKLTEKGGDLPPYHGKILSNKKRDILGEKGIGRLAIATIGSQLLILTRAKFGTDPSIVVSFIHWGLFEIPGVDLDEIEIPVKIISNNSLPDKNFVNGLIDKVRKNLKSLKINIPRNTFQIINEELDRFHLDPMELSEILSGPSLSKGQHGTHFYIQPAYKIIQDDIDEGFDDYSLPRLLSVLLGFSNTMSGVFKKPPILAQFRDHFKDATTHELLGGDNFFQPDEFKLADHHFKGKFDEYGKFRGKVSIYGSPEVNYIHSWGNNRKKTSCGPFSINFAHLHGKASQSNVPPDIHTKLYKKLNRSGGLYVYKNNLRVLPYGEPDYDFLQIEKRRTLGAAYYFFSHRRMFGVIETTAEMNPKLVEKAGREGFQENQAYREFRSILRDLLINLANDFFREKGEYVDIYNTEQNNVEQRNEVRSKRAKETKKARVKLSKDLDSFFKKINRGQHEKDVADLRLKYFDQIESISDLPRKELMTKARNLEKQFFDALDTFRTSYKITYPKGVGLNKTLRRDYLSYENQYEMLESDYLLVIDREFSNRLSKLLLSAGKLSDTRDRFNTKLKELSDGTRQKLQQLINVTDLEVNGLKKIVTNKTAASSSKIDTALKESITEFRKVTGGNVTHAKIRALFDKLHAKISKKIDKESESLLRLSHSLSLFSDAINNAEYTPDELTEALEEKLEDLTEEIDESAELLHIGMALGIIQHEFLNTINQVRNSIQRLQPWAETNPELINLYKEIQSSFEHLAGYLKLFDPLSRRLNPTKIKVTGEEVYIFLINMFSERLKKEDISLTASEKFKAKSVIGFSSTFYPSFVNLVDNSIYWVTEFRDKNRSIILDANRNGFTVKDNGPGIEERYKDRIFDFGFTRKSTGRGMGLYITREALRREDHELVLLHNEEGKGVTFQITLEGNN